MAPMVRYGMTRPPKLNKSSRSGKIRQDYNSEKMRAPKGRISGWTYFHAALLRPTSYRPLPTVWVE
jgi:hypothetical protein